MSNTLNSKAQQAGAFRLSKKQKKYLQTLCRQVKDRHRTGRKTLENLTELFVNWVLVCGCGGGYVNQKRVNLLIERLQQVQAKGRVTEIARTFGVTDKKVIDRVTDLLINFQGYGKRNFERIK